MTRLDMQGAARSHAQNPDITTAAAAITIEGRNSTALFFFYFSMWPALVAVLWFGPFAAGQRPTTEKKDGEITDRTDEEGDTNP